INFAGEGKRGVSVGYVVENPIWKTSYRLVMSKEGKPFLQGWAIVENPSDEDWNAVKMALISGRPVPFQMDLYQPLYVPRPMVARELFASLRPPTYEGAVGNNPADGRAFRSGQGTGVPVGGAMPPGAPAPAADEAPRAAAEFGLGAGASRLADGEREARRR